MQMKGNGRYVSKAPVPTISAPRRRQNLHEGMQREKMQQRCKVGRERPWKGGVAPGQNMNFAAAKK